ncbi:MAG: alpha-galactosidase [Clostridia bacterium]|nr:alpha-galactosidase [Clostridia bacterium]
MKYYIEPESLTKYVSVEETADGGIVWLRFKVKFDAPRTPEKISVCWNEPITETYSFWGPNVGTQRHLAPSWGPRITSSRLASGAPVHSIISSDGSNRLTVAISDADSATDIATGVFEDTAEMQCRVKFFTNPLPPITEYSATIRLDRRRINYCDVLRDAASWWENDCGYKPCRVPYDAKMPMNSLWYSFHQYLEHDKIVEQCRLSAPFGMKTVIIDDGWQTADKGGYSHCGDWEPVGLSDIRETVEDIHKTGMKVILWYSVPFIGIYSKNYERFKDMTLYSLFDDTTYVLDPRYKEVRDYLVAIYKNAIVEYKLDGLKLDFIDSFCHSDRSLLPDERRDYVSLDEAVDALMTETYDALTAVDPDVMIEFRQSYTGPAIRKFGNMLRVGDCACDALANRRAIIDLRLISGDTAVHSDMLMWNTDDPVESVALQLGSVLFGVPQISMKIERLPEDHKRALKFYLDFWISRRDLLMNGTLYAASPETTYSQAYVEKDNEAVLVAYDDPVVKCKWNSFTAVNCGAGDCLYFDGANGLSYKVVNCTGDEVSRGTFSADIEKLPVPRGGMVFVL